MFITSYPPKQYPYIVFIDKVLLFLTGGTPDDSGSPESVYSTLSDLNGQLNNSVVVLTYFLSTGLYCN